MCARSVVAWLAELELELELGVEAASTPIVLAAATSMCIMPTVAGRGGAPGVCTLGGWRCASAGCEDGADMADALEAADGLSMATAEERESRGSEVRMSSALDHPVSIDAAVIWWEIRSRSVASPSLALACSLAVPSSSSR